MFSLAICVCASVCVLVSARVYVACMQTYSMCVDVLLGIGKLTHMKKESVVDNGRQTRVRQKKMYCV